MKLIALWLAQNLTIVSLWLAFFIGVREPGWHASNVSLSCIQVTLRQGAQQATKKKLARLRILEGLSKLSPLNKGKIFAAGS